MAIRFLIIMISVLIGVSKNTTSLRDQTAKLQNKHYYLTAEAYTLADHLFKQETVNFEQIKNQSLLAMNTFLDLVEIMNDEMAKELRSAIIKFYKIKYLNDYTDYIISMEEMVNITSHCMWSARERPPTVRAALRRLVANSADVRHFHSLDKCLNSLPDEVATAHCILHQAVLFNGTMHDNLMTIIEIKIDQYCTEINETIFEVSKCLSAFVPRLPEQLLCSAYSADSWRLHVVNASSADMTRDRWRRIQYSFPQKWAPLLALLKKKQRPTPKQLLEPLQLLPASLDLAFRRTDL